MSLALEASRQTAAPPTKRTYSVADVGAMLGVKPATVRLWIKTGRLPRPLRIGNTIRWPVEVIDSLLSR